MAPHTAGGTVVRHAIGRANGPELVQLTVCPYDPATPLPGELSGKPAKSEVEDAAGTGREVGRGGAGPVSLSWAQWVRCARRTLRSRGRRSMLRGSRVLKQCREKKFRTCPT